MRPVGFMHEQGSSFFRLPLNSLEKTPFQTGEQKRGSFLPAHQLQRVVGEHHRGAGQGVWKRLPGSAAGTVLPGGIEMTGEQVGVAEDPVLAGVGGLEDFRIDFSEEDGLFQHGYGLSLRKEGQAPGASDSFGVGS